MTGEPGSDNLFESLPDDGVAEIYAAYPRHVGKIDAMKAIEKAIHRLIKGEYEGHCMSRAQAIAGLKERALMFAGSPAGQKEKFTPYPATWFNRGRYLDDIEEWNHEEGNRSPAEQRATATHSAIIDGLRNHLEQRNGNQRSQQQNRADSGSDHGVLSSVLRLPSGGD